jgi:glycosyltransferase XagB
VAARLNETAPNVACLQGILDNFNARQNWISHCFSIEYATWWRVVLPGMARLGFVIKLRGTTLFLRRKAL